VKSSIVRGATICGLLLCAACQNNTGQVGNLPHFFRDIAEETGLKFQHVSAAAGEYAMPEIMGAGVALIDYDQDGDLDVLLIQSGDGKSGGTRLFRNELVPSGKLRFTDVTEQAGIRFTGYGMGVAVGDYDNDGFPDIYITGFGQNALYHNNGNGTFTDVTKQTGVDDVRWSTGATWFDYDGDGRLDLFVLHYLDFAARGAKKCYAPTGERDYCTPAIYHGVPARLLCNLGNGKFRDVTLSAGVGTPSPGLGVIAADFNGDGLVDLYVANDGAANRLWINKGNGTFEDRALVSGVAYSADGLPQAGMGVTAGDPQNAERTDILVTNLAREGVAFYQNDGKGNFQEVSREAGLFQPTFPFTGFGVQWFDYDNDGWPDLFIANGAVTIIEAQRGEPYPFHQPNQLLHNEGGRFRDVSGEAGPALKLSEVSRGAAFGDIDNDGRIDIVVTNNNGPVRLLHNESRNGNHWLTVRLQPESYGARIAVLRKGQKTLWGRVHTDGSYLSASDARVHFGLGDQPTVDAVVVYWPDGSVQRVERVEVDRLLTVKKAGQVGNLPH
jgi:hypothetical protein